MLHPAHVGHLPVLRALIRDGAVRGGFDRELATDSRESTMFFYNLRRALTTGYFIEEDPDTGDLTTVAVPGYVFHPDRDGAASHPIGFGLFKAIAIGYELWLTGIEPAWRGHGHGRTMIGALLATPPGRRAYVVRVHRFGRDSAAMAHLLAGHAYAPASESLHHSWFVRSDAPVELADYVKGAVKPSQRTH